MAKSTRKRRPKAKFPLTLHPTGQWCKKISGKLYYFGTDKQEAYERYLREATDLHHGRRPEGRIQPATLSIKDLANDYLSHQEERVEAGELSLVHLSDCLIILKAFVKAVGKHSEASELTSDRIFHYRSALMKKHAPNTVNRHLGTIKAMFNYALDFNLLDHLPNLRRVLAKVPTKQVRQFKAAKKRVNGEPVLTPLELKTIIEAASSQLKAMILLGINGGFGNTDCAQLRVGDVDLKQGLIDYYRVKTGIRRTVPLWSETAAAIKAVLLDPRPVARQESNKDLVFLTRLGYAWVRVSRKDTPKDSTEIAKNDEIVKQFTKLLTKLKLKRPALGFYTLRHTHATLADRARDVHAQKRVMGHAIPGMLGEYVEDIDLDRLRAVVDVVRTAIFGEQPKNDSQQANSEPQKA